MITSQDFHGIPVAAYAEPFIAGRRVLVFGASTSPLPQQLIERGAKLVHVLDANEAQANAASLSNTSRSIRYTPLSQAEAQLQERAFEFGIIEDLSSCSEPAQQLQQLTRALSPRGAALVGVPSPEASLRPALSRSKTLQGPTLGYYELYDHVAEHFSDVRMLGQLPFVGYAIADFSAEREADVSVDTAFMPGGAEEPEWFWALASHEPVVGEAFAIIQLPLTTVLSSAALGNSSAAAPSEATLAEPLNARIAQLEHELSRRPTPERDTAAETALNARVTALATELKQKEAWLAQVEARATAADTRADQAESELEQLKLAAREKSNNPLPGEAKSDLENDVAKLEDILRERAAFVAQLEQRLAEAERVVGDLVRELEALRRSQTQPSPVNEPTTEVSDFKSRLDNLALANAERAALLATAEATIRELEQKLLNRAPAPTAASAEELELARAEIQRQATLLAQNQAKNDSDLPS